MEAIKEYLERIYSTKGYTATATHIEEDRWEVEMDNGETFISWEVSATFRDGCNEHDGCQNLMVFRTRLIY